MSPYCATVSSSTHIREHSSARGPARCTQFAFLGKKEDVTIFAMSAQHVFTPANLPLFLYFHGGPTRFFARGPGLHPGAKPQPPVSFCQKAESDARLRENGENGVFRLLQQTELQHLAEGSEKHCGARGFPPRSEEFSSAEKIRALRGGKNFSPQRKSSETKHADFQRLAHKSRKQPRE